MDTENTQYKNNGGKTAKIIKLIFKILLLSLVLFVYGFFILRICTMEPSEDIRKIVWNDPLLQTYQNNPDGFSAYTQNAHTNIDTNGYMAFYDVIYIPEAKQLQMTVRYNKSTVKTLKETYNLSSDIKGEHFAFCLALKDGGTITEYTFTSFQTNRYHFRHLIFENVDLESFTVEKTEELTDSSALTDEGGDGYTKVYDIHEIELKAYYIEDVNLSEAPFVSLTVFNRDLGMRQYNYKKYLPEKDSSQAEIQQSPYFIVKES